MKNPICLNEHKMRNCFACCLIPLNFIFIVHVFTFWNKILFKLTVLKKSGCISLKSSWRLALWYEVFQYLSGEQKKKCVKLCIIQRWLYCLKRSKSPHFHDVIEKEIFDLHSKENHFMVSKILNFLILILYTRKQNILILPYSTITHSFLLTALWRHDNANDRSECREP